MDTKGYFFGELEGPGKIKIEDIENLKRESRQALKMLSVYPVERIIKVFDRCSKAWSNPAYPERVTALKHLPYLLNLPVKMIEAAISEIVEFLSMENLNNFLKYELNKVSPDTWKSVRKSKGYLMSIPYGTVMHILSENIFTDIVYLLVIGLLSKNVNIMRLSKIDPLFPLLFIKTIKQQDEDGIVSSAFSAIPFELSDELETKLLSFVDIVIVSPPLEKHSQKIFKFIKDKPIISYPFNFSCVIIPLDFLNEENFPEFAFKIVKDVIRWNQSGRMSPKYIYLETTDENVIFQFIHHLACAFEEINEEYPVPEFSIEDSIIIRKTRLMAEYLEVKGKGKLFAKNDSIAWTIIYEKEHTNIKFHIKNRTLIVQSYENIEELLKNISKKNFSFETVGLPIYLAKNSQKLSKKLFILSEKLVRAGFHKITDIGDMTANVFSLSECALLFNKLTRLVTIDKKLRASKEQFSRKNMSNVSENLITIANYAKKLSIFYSEKYKDIKLRNISDFRKLPLLTPEEIHANLPLKNTKLLTAPFKNVCILNFKNKLWCYTYQERQLIIKSLRHILQLSQLTENDIVYDLTDNNLYFSEAIPPTSATVFINHEKEITSEKIVKNIERFKITTLIGTDLQIYSLAKFIINADITALPLNKVIYTGSVFCQNELTYIKKAFKTDSIFQAGCEIAHNLIGYKCSNLYENFYHLFDDMYYIEILYEGTNEPVAYGDSGELIITSLFNRFMPLIRFKTGDKVRLLNTQCRCGNSSPIFELVSKVTDSMRIGDVVIYKNDFNILKSYPEAIRNYQLILYTLSGIPRLLLKLESNFSLNKENLRKFLLENSPKLKAVLTNKYIDELSLEIIKPGSLNNTNQLIEQK